MPLYGTARSFFCDDETGYRAIILILIHFRLFVESADHPIPNLVESIM